MDISPLDYICVRNSQSTTLTFFLYFPLEPKGSVVRTSEKSGNRVVQDTKALLLDCVRPPFVANAVEIRQLRIW
jgi:hypothetical protein